SRDDDLLHAIHDSAGWRIVAGDTTLLAATSVDSRARFRAGRKRLCGGSSGHGRRLGRDRLRGFRDRSAIDQLVDALLEFLAIPLEIDKAVVERNEFPLADGIA